MQPSQDTWTRCHDLALIYIALAYGTDKQLDDAEIVSLTSAIKRWRPEDTDLAVREIVMEAMAVFLETDADEEVARSIRSVKSTLSVEQRRDALEDAVRIAEADGILTHSETSMISVIADIWEVQETKERLMDESSVAMEEKPSWSLLHDIVFLYIVLAHGSNNKLDPVEIEAMIERLGAWQPDLPEEELKSILREALQYYSQGLDKEDVDESASSIMDSFARAQRMGVLTDLEYIATVDGEMNEMELDMIELLAQVWKVDVRLDEMEIQADPE